MSYANYTAAQCFAFPSADQVQCSEQHLNVSDPPSIYSFWQFNELWEPISCYLWNVTLEERVDVAGTFNYCTVPLRSYDAFLFVSLALLVSALLFGRLSAVWALVAGGILGCINYYANLLHISNAISLWLSIQPADLFLYAFLPPLLVETSIRLDFFNLSKIWPHALLLASVMVFLSLIALTPIILFVLGFQHRGWSWVQGALFSAIISPTDALAVTAILSSANGPERLIAIIEGESLFNDATGLTLFAVFSNIIYAHASEVPPVWPSVWSVIPTIIGSTARLAAVGAGIGLGMSWATGYLLRWLRWRGAMPYIETTVVLAVSYLAFYVTNSPANGSGVVAVVVYGLYGNATSKWGMLATVDESGDFDAAWDFISFVANGLVFFWSGVASINYFIRSVQLLTRTAWSYAAIPLIWVFMLVIRTACIAAFNPLFRVLGEDLTIPEIVFTGWSGLRGSLSLIMVSSFTAGSRLTFEQSQGGDNEVAAVNADISLWTAAFVLLTLMVNGPLIGPLLSLLRLNRLPLEKLKMRTRAKRALFRFTNGMLASLREDDDEFLQGAHWEAVAQYVDMTPSLAGFDDASFAVARRGTGSADAADMELKTTSGVVRLLWRGLLRGMVFWSKRTDAHKVSDDGATADRGHHFGVSNGEHASPTSRKKVSDVFVHGTLGRKSADGVAPARVSSSEGGPGTSGDGMGTDENEESPQGPQNMTPDKVWSDLSAHELAKELHDECPFLSWERKERTRMESEEPPPDDAEPDLELGLGSPAREHDSSDANVPATVRGAAEHTPGTRPRIDSFKASGDKSRSATLLSTVEEHQLKTEISSIGDPHRKDLPWDPRDESGQSCITAATGPQMLQELRKTLETKASSQTEGLITDSSEHPEYYSSLPALAGRGMKEDLHRAISGQQPSQQEGALGESIKVSGVIEAAYPEHYATVPAEVGRNLQAELQAEQARHRAAGDTLSTNELGSDEDAVSGPLAVAAPLQAPSSSAYAGGGKFTNHNASTSSMPAAVGRATKLELQRHLRSMHVRGVSHGSDISSADPEKGPLALEGSLRADAPARPDWDSYLATVSGVIGANLQAELKQQMRRLRVNRGSERDLLGRRVANLDSGSESIGGINNRLGPDRVEGGGSRFLGHKSVAPASTPMATALFEKRKAEAHGVQRKPSQTSLRSSTSSELGPHPELPSRLRASWRPALHPASRLGPGLGALEGGRSSPVPETPAMLLSRTFSIGKSLIRRPTFTELSDDQEINEPGAESATKEGSSQSLGKLPRVARSYSATTIPNRSIDAEEEVQGEAGELKQEDAALLGEMRTRLLAGFKRYFVGKRLTGMLSVDGLRILQYACDKADDETDHGFHLWSLLEKEISGGWKTRLVSRMSLATTRAYRSLPQWLQTVFSVPFKSFAGLLRRYLGRRMLVACEIAVEYYLALLGSPQIQWLKTHGDACWRLLDEVEHESDAAYRFIIAREIEAPDRFQAIQSYRAAMAVLRQQLLFIDELFEIGMIDLTERRAMSDPVDRKMRHLEIVGPVWRPPLPRAVLRSLPFIAELPDAEFRQIWEAGSLKEFRKGQCIWTASDIVRRTNGSQGPGGFVVLFGVVKRLYIRADGVRKEYYQGAGGVIGVLLCLTGTKLPGTEMAIAEGNALGKGPVVFHVPQSVVVRIRAAAARGKPEMVALEDDLLRLSAAYVVESMEIEVAAAVAKHIEVVSSATRLHVPTAQLHRRSSLKEGERRGATTSLGATNPQSPLIAHSLLPSKSVGANLAAMLHEIEQMEYDEDGEGEERETVGLPSTSVGGRASLGIGGPRMRAVSTANTASRPRRSQDETEFGDRSLPSPFQSAFGAADDLSTKSRSVRLKKDAAGPGRHTTTDGRGSLAGAMIRTGQIAADIVQELRRGLHTASIVLLAPNENFTQTSHTVLLAGSVQADEEEVMEVSSEIAAPRVFPWFWDERIRRSIGASVAGPDAVDWKAGTQGATLAVCCQPDGRIPRGVVEWQESSALPSRRPTDVTSFPIDGTAADTGGFPQGSSVPGSEQGSLMGNAAAAVGREFSAVLSRLRRSATEPPRHGF